MSIRSINSVLEKKNKPISLLHSYTGFRWVYEVHDFPNQGDSILSISNSGQHPNKCASMAVFIVPANVFVQVCLNVCIGNNGTVTTQYLQK